MKKIFIKLLILVSFFLNQTFQSNFCFAEDADLPNQSISQIETKIEQNIDIEKNKKINSENKNFTNLVKNFPQKQINFSKPASNSMNEIIKLHNVMFLVMMAVLIFVCVLLVYIIYKFSEKRGHKPQKFTHNLKLEIAWIAIPFLIVIFLATTSLKTLNKIEKFNYSEESDITLKIVGHQWYWTYEYPQYGIKFDSYMKQDKDLLPGDKRLLSTDNVVYLPERKNIKVIVTADDVIHAWALPELGVKKDCVPGRLNETWFKANFPGIFYGQCSELCGVLHGFMPIEVRVLNEEDFRAWTDKAKQEFPI